MLRQIRTQLFIVFLCSLFLVIGSYAVSYIYIHDHTSKEIAQAIIRDHRFIIQRLTWLSLVEPEDTSIRILVDHFENNLQSIDSEGIIFPVEGEPYELSAEADSILRTEYRTIAQFWPEYKSQLENVLSQSQNTSAKAEAWLELQAQDREIIQGIDEAYEKYESYINAQHKIIEQLQIGFIFMSIPVILIGMHIVRNKIIKPIAALNKSADGIRQGKMDQVVEPLWDDEIGELAQSMESMRKEIVANKKTLEARIAERTHALTVVTRFSQEVSRKIGVEEIIQYTIDQAKELLQAQEASVCLASSEGNALEMVANGSGFLSGQKPQQPLHNEIAISNPNQAHITNLKDSHCDFLNADSDHLCLSSSLRVGEQIIGAMCITRQPDMPFRENEKQAYVLLANSAAIAIYNQYLIEKGKQQVTDAVKLTERQRLASDLHDDIAQNLGVTQMQIGHLVNKFESDEDSETKTILEKLQMNMQAVQEQIRVVISGLSAKAKENLPSLREGLEECIADFRKLCDIPVKLSIEDFSLPESSELIQRQLVLILREALVNIRRHSFANTVQVTVQKSGQRLSLSIEDDGKGFDPGQEGREGHFGLKIMQARAERSGGNLTIKSAPGDGTLLIASFDLNEEEKTRIMVGEGIVE